MESFAISGGNYQRISSLFPPLLSLAYSKRNPPAPKAWPRDTVNIGLILSAPFDEAKYEMDGKMYSSTIPSFSCIQPGWVCRQANPGCCEKLFFTYDKCYQSHFTHFANRPEAILMPLEINQRIQTLLDGIFLLAPHHERPGNIDRLDYLCAQLVTELMIVDKARLNPHDTASTKLKDIVSFINIHFCETIDLKKLIVRTGMSERTFNRRWKEHFDLSPHAYILNKRINKACRLLLETDLKIYQVATETGFDDPYYFSRLFRKHTSYSPLEYRNSH